MSEARIETICDCGVSITHTKDAPLPKECPLCSLVRIVMSPEKKYYNIRKALDKICELHDIAVEHYRDADYLVRLQAIRDVAEIARHRA